MDSTQLKSSSLLLGVALAGLAGFTTEAEAATVATESADFSNDLFNPTGLTSFSTDFFVDGGIVGQMIVGSFGSGDVRDAILISGPASVPVTIPFSVTSTSPNAYFELVAYNGVNLLTAGSKSLTNPGETYAGTLNFTMPASGQVTLSAGQETGNTTYNYTIGAVPEPTTGLLSLAGLASLALQRRRKQA